MDCEDFRKIMEELPPTSGDSEAVEAELVQHLKGCPACDQWFKESDRKLEESPFFTWFKENRYRIFFKSNDPSMS